VDERTVKLMADFQLKSVAKLLGGELVYATGVDSSGKMYDKAIITYNEHKKDDNQ